MAGMVPECLFNTSMAIETSDQGILVGGNNWYANVEYLQPSYCDDYVAINRIFTMSPEELAELDDVINVHNSRETGIKKKLFSFGEGVDFYVSVYARTEFELAVFVHGCIYYNGTFYYDITGLQESESSWSDGSTNPVNLSKTYGIKFALITNYTWGNGEAVTGETQATYLDLMAFIPGYNKNSASGFQSWQHIKENEVYFISKVEDDHSGVYERWIYNPQYLYYGYTDNRVSVYTRILRVGNLTNFYNALKGLNPALQNPFKQVEPDDPSQEQDPSGPGGGGGNMDPSSDPIPFPDLPVGGALASGAVKAFEVSPTAMTQMFLKLWDSSIFDIATFQKLVESPLDSLIQLQAVPIDPHTSGTGHIMLGNFDTDAIAPVIDQEYYTIDCGTLNVQEFWGSALDYNPYTECTLWVPMVGFRDVDVNDIMGKMIHLKYNYSIFDGNLTAQLMCGNAVLYKWPGNVMETIPVSQRVNEKMKAIASGAASILGGAVGGGGAGLAAGAISAAVNVAFAQTHVSRSGTMEGSTGLLDDFMPYLIIKRPIQSLAAGFKTQKGYPSNMTAVLNTCSGYTEVEYIHLTGISGATDTELQEIESLLKEGVII